MAVARLRQRPAGQRVHIGGHIRVGFRYLALVGPHAHGRTFLQRQGVEGDMLRRQGCQSLDGVLPLGEGLVGQAVHQIEVDIVETGGAGCLERFDGSVGGVAAAQQSQQAVVQALHADAEAVDALAQQSATGVGVQVAGIGFNSDFRP